jgi:thiamine kinase-like enzyme
VLTHNDLSMRNIIVDRDGKLWLVVHRHQECGI